MELVLGTTTECLYWLREQQQTKQKFEIFKGNKWLRIKIQKINNAQTISGFFLYISFHFPSCDIGYEVTNWFSVKKQKFIAIKINLKAKCMFLFILVIHSIFFSMPNDVLSLHHSTVVSLMYLHWFKIGIHSELFRMKNFCFHFVFPVFVILKLNFR